MIISTRRAEKDIPILEIAESTFQTVGRRD